MRTLFGTITTVNVYRITTTAKSIKLVMLTTKTEIEGLW